MNSKKSKKSVVILLVLLAVVLMTIGFAAYAGVLNINGTAKVKASSWNVRYNNVDDEQGTPYGVVPTANSKVTAETETISDNDTKFEFTVPLNAPGDVYEVTIYPHNYGTLTAYLKSVTMSSLTEAQAKYLSYTVTYDGTQYTSTQTGITGKGLAAGAQVPVIVRLEYLQPTDSKDLPATDETITITGSFGYSSEDTAQSQSN